MSGTPLAGIRHHAPRLSPTNARTEWECLDVDAMTLSTPGDLMNLGSRLNTSPYNGVFGIFMFLPMERTP